MNLRSLVTSLAVLIVATSLPAAAVEAAETPPASQSAPTMVPEAPPAPPSAPAIVAEAPKAHSSKWYDRISIRGYGQIRDNNLPSFHENDALVNAQGDRTIGGNNGISIRRARLIVYGDVHDRVAIYLQPDFASVINDQLNVAILRDFYSDVFLTADKAFRLRIGQSKVPFGFENMQSSQNRAPLDRSDAVNSAVKDERDIGVFFYWAPPEIRARFKELVDTGLKGSGDYGVFALGPFNGQTANRPAKAEDLHVVTRVTWPFKFGKQFVEVGGGGYYGRFEPTVDSSGTYILPTKAVDDARAVLSVVVYPQPIGFQAEGSYGIGPSLGGGTQPDADEIKARPAYGAYAMLLGKFDHVLGEALVPYARATYYNGGKKFETNAPHYLIRELEVGVEWQIWKAAELTLAYDFEDRTSSTAPYLRQKGQITRVQFQANF